MASRIPQLDGLRFAAVALVAGHHWNQFVGCRAAWSAEFWRRTGWTGVDLFFVLSGFLISGLLFGEYRRRGTIGLGRFFVRRGLKIYPGFYVLMAVTVAIGAVRPAIFPTLSGPHLAAELLFVQNYFPAVFNHTWSLAIEEHFYFSLALVLWLLARRGRGRPDPFRSILAWAPAMFALCLALRAAELYAWGYNWWRLYAPTHLRLDALLFGVWLSYFAQFHGERFVAFVRARRGIILAVSIPLVLTCAAFRQNHWFMVTLGITCLFVGYGGILVVALFGGGPSKLGPYDREGMRGVLIAAGRVAGRSAAWIGQYSYSIYLWHMPAVFFARAVFGRDVPTASPARYTLCLATYLALTFGGGIIAARLVEMPVLRLRDRLFPARSAATVA